MFGEVIARTNAEVSDAESESQYHSLRVAMDASLREVWNPRKDAMLVCTIYAGNATDEKERATEGQASDILPTFALHS